RRRCPHKQMNGSLLVFSAQFPRGLECNPRPEAMAVKGEWYVGEFEKIFHERRQKVCESRIRLLPNTALASRQLHHSDLSDIAELRSPASKGADAPARV